MKNVDSVGKYLMLGRTEGTGGGENSPCDGCKKLEAAQEELDAEVTDIVQIGSKNWKRVSCVLCDRKMNVKIKGTVYRTVVRPAPMYGADTRYMGIEESTGKEIGGRNNTNATMHVRSFKAGQDTK